MTLPGPASIPLTIDAASARIQAIEQAIGTVIVGQHQVLRRLLTGLFAAIPYSFSGDEVRTGCGPVLLEGVPGVAKTLMLHHVNRRLDVETLRRSDVTHGRRLIADSVYVDDKVREHIVRIGRATCVRAEAEESSVDTLISRISDAVPIP
jgi:hypothetical protein